MALINNLGIVYHQYCSSSVAVRHVLVISVDELGLTQRPLQQQWQGRRQGCPWHINVIVRTPKTSADVTGLVIVLIGVIPVPALVTA
jgi:hypothetical protein